MTRILYFLNNASVKYCAISLFFSCFLYTTIGYAQKQDSLLNLSYPELKKQYRISRYKEPQISKTYALAIIKKATIEFNDYEKYNSYLLLGSLESYFGNIEEALRLVDTTITKAKTIKNEKLLTRAFNQKGKVYYEFGKYDKAILFYLKVDSLAKKTNDIRVQISSKHSIGSVKIILGDHQGATRMFQENLDKLTPLYKEKQYVSNYINTLIALCSTYTFFDLEAAEQYLPKIKEASLAENDKDALSYYYTLKGIVAYKQQHYDSALQTLQQADSLVTILGRKRSLYPVYRFQGKSYYEKNMLPEAIEAFEKIKELQKDIDFDHFKLQEILSLLAVSYEKSNNIEKALENFNLALEISKSNDTLKTQISNQIIGGYTTKKLQDKIGDLASVNQKKKKENYFLIFLSLVLVLGFILLLFIYRKYKIDNKVKFENLLNHIEDMQKQEKTLSHNSKEKNISDDKVQAIINALKKFEQDKLFLNKNTSLNYIAKKLNTNTSYLSKIINEHKQQSFPNYITTLRIDYAILKLKEDKNLRRYSIKAIAKELGFKSEGAFSRAFKKQTGIYPSFYIKNLASNL